MQLSKPRVVIIGAGFGGLQAAKSFKNSRCDVVLVDKMNHHLFQPLLYQVAVSALSPGDIASPVRTILRGYDNVQILMNNASEIDLQNRIVKLTCGEIEYDYLILAPGSRHSYFGNNHWEEFAPGLKNLADALRIREKILSSFEVAERLYNTPEAEKYLTFVIVGGGPTGIELAGSIAEVARKTMLTDFPLLKSDDIKVKLIEAGDRLLNSYPTDLSDYTLSSLEELGVQCFLNTRVMDITNDKVITSEKDIPTANVIWAAGNQASPLLKSLNVNLDRMGRAIVNKDMTIGNYNNVFVIGDAANCIDAAGIEVPGIAPAAVQQSEYVAKIIRKRIPKQDRSPFKYRDKGNMATIGRAKAIAMISGLKFKGLFAWFLWSFIHIFYLIDFRNRFKVMLEWIWFYITYKPGASLITHYIEDCKKDEITNDKIV